MNNESLSAKIGVLESRLAVYDEEIEALAEQRSRKIKARAQDQKELDRLQARATGRLPLEDVRDAVVKLGTFTKNELASELGVTAARLTKPMAELEEKGMLRELAFRAFGKKTYEHVVSAEAGAAFLAQQRLRLVGPTPEEQALAMAVMPARGEPVERSSTVDDIGDKDVKRAVKWAQARGWELDKKRSAGGKGHFRLRKVLDGMSFYVTVPTTPQNSSGAANIIRDQVARAERGVA